MSAVKKFHEQNAAAAGDKKDEIVATKEDEEKIKKRLDGEIETDNYKSSQNLYVT